MLMLMLLLLEREMREEFSFEEEEAILYTNFQKFSPVHVCMGKALKKKREHAEERERVVCVVWSSVFFLSTLPSIRLNKITRRR